jgi:signal recognition particle subunit SRP54
MFESLQDGLKSAFKSLRGKGKLTEGNMRDGLKLVEKSLIEADVSYDVVKDFMGRVTEESLGEKVLLSLQPGEQLVGIVHRELINLLGPVDPSIPLKPKDQTTIIMMCGLQGSGKTTTCGKLGKLLKRQKVTPLLVAADLQRPAAIEQLHVIGRQLEIPVYSEPGAADPVAVCHRAVEKAKQDGIRIVILDTAGRLAIDLELMKQLQRIDQQVHPDHVYLVVDGMTGQDAVNSAKAFNDALELDGVIMTKLDGDARGGALLSVKSVTGVPIKFIGTGEHLDMLEPFRAEGMAGRILGMGDIVQLVNEAQNLVDEKEQERLQEQLKKGEFTLDDFRNQIQKFAKPGLMMRMLTLLPGMGQLSEAMSQMGEQTDQIKQLVGIIDSMTPAERRDPKVINPSRRNRISQGAGVAPQQVNDLVKQFDIMKPLITGMAGGDNIDKAQALEQMRQQAMNPFGRFDAKPKKDTGRRLSTNEKAKNKKQREKELRKLMRERKQGLNKDKE